MPFLSRVRLEAVENAKSLTFGTIPAETLRIVRTTVATLTLQQPMMSPVPCARIALRDFNFSQWVDDLNPNGGRRYHLAFNQDAGLNREYAVVLRARAEEKSPSLSEGFGPRRKLRPVHLEKTNAGISMSFYQKLCSH